ncbi:enoyl-CoA hydratase/isomerase family protein [Streptomyces sp. NPDC005438]|uniref:enoyl-CoA hydratase/isomerase family protein n=1 Tax=Streptomyces sp. NPDC005438 TaxID=3156880 RepID=UPI0033B45571
MEPEPLVSESRGTGLPNGAGGPENADGVVTLTLSNPAKRNALTPAMWRRLVTVLDELARDRTVRVLVLTGAGDTFSAGADIGSLREEPGALRAVQELTIAAEEALARFPHPTLAAIRGHCVGGGCQLAVACDLRFASQDARLGITPAKLGIVYPEPATRRLADLVGPATAKYLLFSGELVDAPHALRTGLVDEVHPAERLSDRVAAFARTLSERSPLTQRAAKEFVAGFPDAESRAERVAHWRREEGDGAEAREGVSAYLERRSPRFTWGTTGK